MNETIRILFLCGSNSCRSQMAEGFANTFGGDEVTAASAGVTAGGVHPLSVEVMGELDIDISQHTSKTVDALDIDSFDSPTFGKQEGSAYNGHFGYTRYQPLFVFNQYGDIERALLRNGNVYSSDD